MGKQPLVKKPAARHVTSKKPAARKVTRIPQLPDWAKNEEISERQWRESTRQQKERWRYAHLYTTQDNEDSDAELDDPCALRVYQRSYTLPSLDLSLARECRHLQKWPDQHCVDALMSALEATGGALSFRTYFSNTLDRGRLLVEWPTPLHVNKEFRACILFLQAACFTDLDMSNAHLFICRSFSFLTKIPLMELQVYIRDRYILRGLLTAQGLEDDVAKRLWLSILNGGTLRGWLFRCKQEFPGLAISIPVNLRKHCMKLEAEIKVLRDHVLGLGTWSVLVGDLERANARKSKNRRKPEQMKRSAWNCILCTIETEVVQCLGQFIERLTPAQVVMPSYDGLLLHHASGLVCWSDSLQAQWTQLCIDRWNFVFPVEPKDFLKHLPAYVREILRLRKLIGE